MTHGVQRPSRTIAIIGHRTISTPPSCKTCRQTWGGFPDDLERLKDEVRFIESIVKHWPSSKWRSAAMRMYVNAMRKLEG